MADPVLPALVFFDLGDTLTYIDANNQRQLYADALDTLQILHKRGYRLGLLSNQSPGATVDQVHALLNSLGLAAYIEYDLITISSEIQSNVGKPNKPIFDLALQKAGHPTASNQSVFVTETASHIEAARSYGWRAILKRNAGACQPVDGECASSLSGLVNLLPVIADVAGTNFHLAPPAKLVDGLWAVPIDIQRITATLSFDGSTSSGIGDATLEFRVGHQTGNPFFDLRQTITAAWLDGAPLPVTKLAHHDFGGGAHAELRIVEAVVAAGSTHTLRVTYTLGTPQASTAGSYQPAMTWSSGPRLAFNFGFTDLGAGRYLEAWIPANLIFDQFELHLTLRVLNTPVAHTVITNGTLTSLGANHWSVVFPSRFTALSPLLELRATDTLVKQSDATVLPVSGATVTIEAWKLTSSSVNLADQINNLKTLLANNENSVGPYIHGNRFVAFLNVGGMEYEGGTTTGVGSLRHETFHSWWARGLKPATQHDAWWDEAWTVYNDNGAAGSLPFDFTDPPITLCSRNPWTRVTASQAYTAGERFFKGLGALLGVANLNSLMSDFYRQRKSRPATTTDIEEFLVCRTGNVQLVNAFHRFVYGFGDPSPVPDLWLRDAPAHGGGDQWAGEFWNSPDLWIRNADDGGTIHQNPEYGQDNWFYARVRNRSATATARHFLITFNVKPYAGTEFQYPTDFLPCVAAASGFDLGPAASTIVKARWPAALVLPPGTHACWLAAAFTQLDFPTLGKHIWEHNSLAQKNLTIVNLKPSQGMLLPFVVTNLTAFTVRRVLIEIIRPKDRPEMQASLIQKSGTAFKRESGLRVEPFFIPLNTSPRDQGAALDCGGHVAALDESSCGALTSEDTHVLDADQFANALEIHFASGPTAQLPISLRSAQQLVLGLRFTVPEAAKAGEVMNLSILQRDFRSKRITGGLAVEIHVR